MNKDIAVKNYNNYYDGLVRTIGEEKAKAIINDLGGFGQVVVFGHNVAQQLLVDFEVVAALLEGERSREGNDLWNEMKSSGVLEKTALVFGQMNEPPCWVATFVISS